VDRIQGSRVHHLKELRPGSAARSEIRVLFAFDPTRSALLLLGGDKSGNWQRWYKENIPIAEQLYLDYTAEADRRRHGVSVARVSQIEHGEVTSFEVIAR
jgi:hypothetical protein